MRPADRPDPDDLRKRLAGVGDLLDEIEEEADAQGRFLLGGGCANAKRFVANAIRAEIDLGWNEPNGYKRRSDQ